MVYPDAGHLFCHKGERHTSRCGSGIGIDALIRHFMMPLKLEKPDIVGIVWF
ncbi:hypothetical protein NB311A_15057 [Nitrobacter sp. Nb-311A]|nr:hypothetical protein NB311A_15057 [Nitrobacter sp. Nb-311A]